MGELTRRVRLALAAPLILTAFLPGIAGAQGQEPADRFAEKRTTFGAPEASRAPDARFAPGRVIVKYEEGVGPAVQASVREDEDLSKRGDLDLINAEVVKVQGRSVAAAIRDLEDDPDVAYAEPDRYVEPLEYANEERFAELWGLNNTGQPIRGTAGRPNVDVNAPEAAAVTTGSEDVVVAVIDDGVDFSHPDLRDRAWTNPGEVPRNNIDDDGNGYIDDVNGYDFANDDNTVHDTLRDGHGTHVAGTIAASENGEGVVGVAPNVKLMGVKFLGEFTTTATAIEAIEYASENGARISNNSWGYVGTPSKALKAAIERSGMLFVAAAGNDRLDNDEGFSFDGGRVLRTFPASYDSPNVLSVAALRNTGRLAGFSSFGEKTVDVSAPGVNVLSTIPSVPAESGAALSGPETAELDGGGTVQAEAAGGNVMVAGFGIDEISGAEARASFMGRALSSIDHFPGACPQWDGADCPAPQQVVLVDDDLSSEFSEEGVPDVTPVLSEAIESATGRTPEVIEVGGGNGPDLSRLQGKTVVWATGWAFFSGTPDSPQVKKTLTFQDQNTLARFVNGGGELILTGMDALLGIEDSAFVTDTLGLEVTSEYPTTAFTGAPGTSFAGGSYALDNRPFAIPGYHDIVAPARPNASSLGDASTPPGSEEYASGTSMATPHTAGVAALAASRFPELRDRPVALKKQVMGTGKPAPATRGKTVTGKMVNAEGAVTASPSSRVSR